MVKQRMGDSISKHSVNPNDIEAAEDSASDLEDDEGKAKILGMDEYEQIHRLALTNDRNRFSIDGNPNPKDAPSLNGTYIYVCPFENCQHQLGGFSANNKLQQHLRNVHKWNTAAISSFTENLPPTKGLSEYDFPEDGSTEADVTEDNPRIPGVSLQSCPHGCVHPRGGFLHTQALNRHIREQHQGQKRVRKPCLSDARGRKKRRDL